VTAEEARTLELSFIERFRGKLGEMSHLPSPVDGRDVALGSPPRLDQEQDELTEVQQQEAQRRGLMGPFPHNLTLSHQLVGPKGSRGGVALLASFTSRLALYLSQGFDTAPINRSGLLDVLERWTAKAQETHALYIMGLASPTGWEPPAAQLIAGTDAAPFSSPHLAPLLIDCKSNQVIANPIDGRLDFYRDFYRFELLGEGRARIQLYIREQLQQRVSQSVQEVAEATDSANDLVLEAFQSLEATGAYKLDRISGVGLVITQRGP
jgi:hypothetical protein